MDATYENGNVRAVCPFCNALSTFESKSEGHEFGSIAKDLDSARGRHVYRLLRCAGCGRGGLATIECLSTTADGTLIEFSPPPWLAARLPKGVPEDVSKEFREGEKCLAIGALRAACAMFRSALEKTLKANGYREDDLKLAIKAAASEQMITESKVMRVHVDVRELVNDILHDETRTEVALPAAESARRFTQRVIEDFYGLRTTVAAQLKLKSRIP